MPKFLLFAAVLFALAVAPASGATKIDNPVKFVRGIFAKFEAIDPTKSTSFPKIPEDIYTPHLQALFDQDRREAEELGEVIGNLTFVFWIDSGNWKLSNVTVTGETAGKDRENVTARFRDYGHKKEIRFFFQKTKAGWLLDDARSLVGSDYKGGWTLSLILKYGDYVLQ